MHSPENYLSPATGGVMGAAMGPVWARAIRRVREDIPKERMPLLGVGAAFSFVSMMFNVPLPGGTTGHAVGGTLIAVLLGPDAACLSVTTALLIQALFFGDGGILAFGANCFNMAFLLPYIGYAVYRLLAGRLQGTRGKLIAAALGSYCGINAAALAAAVEFGIQPIFFRDAAGMPLYCPYGLAVSIPAMMIGHLTLFGLAEVIFTVAAYAFVLKAAPDAAMPEKKQTGAAPLYAALAVLICLAPLGLLAQGTAWGEWGVEEMAGLVGYTPSGMTSGFSLDVLMPDYSFGALPDVFAYILSAVIGVAAVILIFRVAAACMKEKTDYSGAN